MCCDSAQIAPLAPSNATNELSLCNKDSALALSTARFLDSYCYCLTRGWDDMRAILCVLTFYFNLHSAQNQSASGTYSDKVCMQLTCSVNSLHWLQVTSKSVKPWSPQTVQTFTLPYLLVLTGKFSQCNCCFSTYHFPKHLKPFRLISHRWELVNNMNLCFL